MSMGMRRLAIINVEGGQQAIYNEDRTLAVFFNGEIYNYRELMVGFKAGGHHFENESDTEVLVYQYKEKGAVMLDDVRGMFAISIYGTIGGSLFLARDRFGKKPLYYTRLAAGGLLYASVLKALPLLARRAGARLRRRRIHRRAAVAGKS